MKILFVIPPPLSIELPQLGLASIAGVAFEQGHNVFIVDLNLMCYESGLFETNLWNEKFALWCEERFCEESFEGIHKILLNQIKCLMGNGLNSFDIVAFHVNYASKNITRMLAERLRNTQDIEWIVAGGPGYFFKEYFGDTLPFDIVFCGEAETSWSNWLRQPFSKSTIGTTVVDLDLLPSPLFSKFQLFRYSFSNALPMETSRGCVNQCFFCNESLMWPGYRMKSFQRLGRDLKEIQDFGMGHVSFIDSLLNPSKKRLSELTSLLKTSALTWDGRMQCKFIDDATAKPIQESGCLHLFLGVESFSPEVLEHFGKIEASSKARQAITSLGKVGVEVCVSLIISGPPFQTEKDLNKDIEALIDLAPYIHSLTVSSLCILPRTELWANAKKLGIKGLDTHDGWMNWYLDDKETDIAVRAQWLRRMIRNAQEVGIKVTDHPLPGTTNL